MIRAKKSLGQNFLRSESALNAIVDAGSTSADDIVLEIGPGEGVLTEKLLKYAGKVVAIEKDNRFISFLQEKFRREITDNRLQIIEGDILNFDENFLDFGEKLYKIIANIPYYITGQVIRKFLGSKKQPESMTLLLQKEVAERIVAKDGKESLLSISIKVFGTPKYIKTVGRGSFAPQPNVDSAIIHIGEISRSKFYGINEEKFFEVLRAGFAHKRKLLTKNLETFSAPSKIQKIFKDCGLSEKIRAENLKVSDWIGLAAKLTQTQ
jgi:16S rRNA (adenine1518-N6/adenine1519-N6)-dimethyltransferase